MVNQSLIYVSLDLQFSVFQRMYFWRSFQKCEILSFHLICDHRIATAHSDRMKITKGDRQVTWKVFFSPMIRKSLLCLLTEETITKCALYVVVYLQFIPFQTCAFRLFFSFTINFTTGVIMVFIVFQLTNLEFKKSEQLV